MPRQSYDTHIFQTYFHLRTGMAAIAIVLPFALWLVGIVLDVPPRPSMSAYYHSVMRDVFVGCLFGIAFCLFLYKGFSRSEDLALNAAGIMAIGVALFPTKVSCMAPPPYEALHGTLKNENAKLTNTAIDQIWSTASTHLDRTADFLLTTQFSFHGAFALVFFFLIAYVAAVSARATLRLIPDSRVREAFRWGYAALAISMVLVPLSTFIVFLLNPIGVKDCSNSLVFALEMGAIEVFGIFWLVKTIEIWRYRTDQKVVD